MELVLNLLFAVLAFLLVRWLSDEAGAPHAVSIVLGVVVAIIIFFANIGGRLL